MALWFIAFWQLEHRTIAVVGALLATGIHAVALGFEFLLLNAVHGDDPTAPATATQLIRAWAMEVFAAPVVFCWRQPFGSHRWPDHLPAGAHGRRGVLLIHGLVCNRGIWNRWLQRLSAQDTPVVAVNLEPMFGSIDHYVGHIESAVRQLEHWTGLPPVAVAHSMGGLALRRWWADQANDSRVSHAITIGTPHTGTWLARFGATCNARQMRLSSPWLAALAAREPPGRAAHFTCYYSHCDNIVFPPANARLHGADNRHLPGVSHVHMADRPEPWAELQRRLQQPAPITPPA